MKKYTNDKDIKKVIIYGDSISTREYGNQGYELKLQKELGIEIIENYAICGSGLTTQTPDNLMNLLKDEKNIHPDADLIIIWHGTNDWYWGSPLGNRTSQSEEEFYGAIKKAIKTLQERCKKANILWLTPMYRYQVPDQCEQLEEAYINPNCKGHTQEVYRRAILEMSELLCFDTLDMRTLCQINPYNAPIYLPDNVHPSDAGYERITKILCSKISTLSFESNSL